MYFLGVIIGLILLIAGLMVLGRDHNYWPERKLVGGTLTFIGLTTFLFSCTFGLINCVIKPP